MPFRIWGSSMPKKRRADVLCGQIILIWLALLMFFVFVTNFVIPSIVVGFVFLAVAMLLETVAYEETPVRQADFCEEKSDLTMVDEPNLAMANRQNEPTPQAKSLHEALNERDIHNELEFGDGHKRVDISIPSARLNIEIDGKYHLTDPEHLFRDLERDSYSHSDGIDTIRVPNFYVDECLDEVADSIAEVAKRRAKK
jgi:very-short-patch-repair endonuclease